jgi:DNA-binding MurR/RpiR family transcriptional regulator
MERSTPECLVKLKAQYNSLNPATRKVADYILANPATVLENNITELAERIAVSQFSIINCIKTTGYNGYKDFKLSLAKDIDTSTTTLFEGFSEDDTAYNILQKVSRIKMRSINDTLHLVSEATFSKAVDMVSSAGKVELSGIGYSYFAADCAAMNFLRLGINASAKRDPNYQKMSASLLSKGDLAIGFSVSGASTSVVSSLEIAKNEGADTIAVTAFANSPITRHADLVLMTTYSEPMFLKDTNNSIVEQTVLVSALTMALAHRDKPNAFYYLSESASVIHNEK